MDEVDACVVGAGVIGLAIGREIGEEIASNSGDLLILDKEPQFGQGISSRNSEVIHAGIYYPENSLKARFCVEGKHRLYEYCAARNIAHQKCGKLIVATSPQEETVLQSIQEKAQKNGVEDLEPWSRNKLKNMEPQVNASMALFSPSTGIVSAHELMASLLGDIEAMGGCFVGQSQVEAVNRSDEGFIVKTRLADGEVYFIRSRVLINAAGLGAQALGHRIDCVDDSMIPALHYCKGNYFVLSGKSPFQHLIYPVPDPTGAGLGVHATLDLGAQLRFGPDVEYIDDENYTVNLNSLPDYYKAIRRYYPGLPDEGLVPAYAGIRPKLQPKGSAPEDFVIQGPSDHGIPGLVQLFGIESPGLTSALAIADYVKKLL